MNELVISHQKSNLIPTQMHTCYKSLYRNNLYFNSKETESICRALPTVITIQGIALRILIG